MPSATGVQYVPCRVLLVEDDLVDHLAFERFSQAQEQPWECAWAASIMEAKKLLSTRSFDVVISDYYLTDGMGLELTEVAHGIPIIFVTGAGNQEIAVKAMKAGAYDYLIKDQERGYLQQMVQTVERSMQRKRMEDEVRQAQRKMEDSLKEKELLLKEIHHRVKNNLQVIASLLNMQSQRLQNEECRAALQDCHLRVQSIALIHQKLYESGDLSRIDFDGYIRSLSTDLFEAYHASVGQIALHINVDDIVLDMDKAIPLGLILNELMSNALKYAFPNGRRGEISIALHRLQGQEWAFDFNDNGIGFAAGFSPGDAPTLGLQIIAALSRQVQGQAVWKNTEGCGFRLVFNA